MTKFRNALLAVGVCLMAFAQPSHADAILGQLWINQSGVASDALLSSVPGLGTPDATFAPGAINYDSNVSSYTIGGFLNNPTFTNQSAAFIANGGAAASLDNTVIYLTGTVGLQAGNNSFVLGHDDGVQLNINGIGLVVDSPLQTAFVNTPFTVSAPSTGNYNFQLVYGECCSAPAALLWTINNVQITSVPDPATPALLVLGLAGIGYYRRRRGSRA